MIFDYMTTRKNDIRLQRKTSSRKQQKQNLIALKRAIMSVASYELMSH
jgi:transcription termination factor NusB